MQPSFLALKVAILNFLLPLTSSRGCPSAESKLERLIAKFPRYDVHSPEAQYLWSNERSLWRIVYKYARMAHCSLAAQIHEFLGPALMPRMRISCLVDRRIVTLVPRRGWVADYISRLSCGRFSQRMGDSVGRVSNVQVLENALSGEEKVLAKLSTHKFALHAPS